MSLVQLDCCLGATVDSTFPTFALAQLWRVGHSLRLRLVHSVNRVRRAADRAAPAGRQNVALGGLCTGIRLAKAGFAG